MLRQPAPFPEVGSAAFLRGTGTPVTIIRRNANGTALVRYDPDRAIDRPAGASANATLPIPDLFEDRDAAVGTCSGQTELT